MAHLNHEVGKPGPDITAFNATEQQLLNDFQHGLPLQPRPYLAMAEQLGVSEQDVIDALDALQQSGVVSRVGPVLRANRVGVSTLAAIAVPPQRLQQVADQVSSLREVNHNYERHHRFNLWFVINASDDEHLAAVLAEIEAHSGLPVLNLPMLRDYFIDLGFDIQWR